MAEKTSKKGHSAGLWLFLIAALLVILVSAPVIDEFIPRKVNIRYITFDGVVETEYSTRAHKVSDFLAEHKDEVADYDMVGGLYEASAMDPGTDDVKETARRFYMSQTGKIDDDEPVLQYKKGFVRTAGSMRGTSGTSADDAAAVPVSDKENDTEEVLFKEEDPGADRFVVHGMTIDIKKAEPATAKIGGKKLQINLYPGDVRQTLKYNGIDVDEDDLIEPDLDHRLDTDDRIKITRVKIVVKEKKEDIEPVEKGAVFDSSIASGTIVRTEGKAGKAVYRYIYKYVNGKKKKTKKEFDHWIKKPTNIQLKFGTSVTGETGEVDFDETFIGNCTAYYFGKNAHGATGQKCHYGTCAVDPKVIPYGTKLYVEGYGTAVANDCGGAVKGHIIDLYMRSTKECFSWGRRNRKVYVLK